MLVRENTKVLCLRVNWFAILYKKLVDDQNISDVNNLSVFFCGNLVSILKYVVTFLVVHIKFQ